MTAATGILSVVLKKPIPAEEKPATPICKNPNNAEALPTFLENGASAKAVALGLVSPKQVNAIKNSPIVASSPYQLFQAPNKKTAVVTTNVYNDTWKICSLEYFLLRKIFNWLPPIKPTERTKISPRTPGD